MLSSASSKHLTYKASISALSEFCWNERESVFITVTIQHFSSCPVFGEQRQVQEDNGKGAEAKVEEIQGKGELGKARGGATA